MTTPSERIIGGAAELIVTQDKGGRCLSLRRPGPLDRLRMFKALGPDLAHNTAYLGMAMLAVSVTSIDGVPLPAPVNEAQLEAVVQRLGDAGLAAIADALASVAESDPGN